MSLTANDARNLRRMPMDATDTVQIIVDQSQYIKHPSSDIGSYADITVVNADQSFMFEVYVATATFNGTYTYNDILGALIYINMEPLSVTDFSCSMTDDGTDYSIDVYVTASDGHCYHFYFEHVTPAATDTIEVMILEPEITTYSDAFSIAGQNETLGIDVMFTIYPDTLDGVYNYSDLYNYSSYTHLTVNNQSLSILGFNALMLYVDVDFTFSAYALASDLHCYHFTMIHEVPDAADTIVISVPDAEIGTYDNAFTVYGETADHSLDASITILTRQINGSYTYDDLFLDNENEYTYFVYNSQQINIVDFSATMVKNGPDFTLDAYIQGDDRHCYHTTFFYQAPVAADTVEIQFEGNQSMFKENEFAVYGWNEQLGYEIELYIMHAPEDGTYSYDDLYMSVSGYSYISHNNTRIPIVGLNSTFTRTPYTYTLDAYILGRDAHCYHAVFAQPIDTVEVLSENAIYFNRHDFFMIAGSDRDSAFIAELIFNDPAGNRTLTLDDVDFDATGDFPLLVNGNELGIIDINATMSLTESDYTFEAYIFALDTTCYHFIANRTFSVQEVEFDSVQVEEVAQYGVYVYSGYSDSCILGVAVKGDELVSRSFDITDLEEALLMVNGTDLPVCDFNAVLTYDGEHDWSMDINLMGADMVIYHAVFEDRTQPAGIDVIPTEQPVVEKFIRDGQLIIRRQGNEYSVQGQQLR